ncbi:MAG: TIGR03643 family protein [Verrucomicrobiota bacterium]|nr:TIGR03643 family protein [Verrucomicrobiota bacterium]
MYHTKLSTEQISAIIRMAWEDRTSFEEILSRSGLSEAEVIRIMRRELKPSSFRLWRKRVSGRVTKHRKRFERRMD